MSSEDREERNEDKRRLHAFLKFILMTFFFYHFMSLLITSFSSAIVTFLQPVKQVQIDVVK